MTLPGTLALAALLLLFGSCGSAPQTSATPTQVEAETALTCQCGCGLTVHSCNHLNCSSAMPLKAEIAEQIAQGRTLQQILEHFEGTYGEKILSSPTTRGFNIAAWTVPFVAIGLGGLLVGFVLWRWRRGSAASPVGPAVARSEANPLAPELRERLERELRELDR